MYFKLILLLEQPIFWPKNLKFWLYNLQILTLFWPIHFLRLQLQNNSALGVEVNPEGYSSTLYFKIFKYLAVQTLGIIWYIDKYINNYSRVKPENIITWNVICTLDWAFAKPSTVRPRFLPRHAYATYYSIVQ